jgi:hypothetical protein
MTLQSRNSHPAIFLFLALAASILPLQAHAATCKTQMQLTPAERDAITTVARGLISNVQSGDVVTMQANTIPAVASNFAGIADSANALKPSVQSATITIDSLYVLDASTEAPGAQRTDFYCGVPLVVMNFNNLPPGTYALAIIHATGVPQPQQIALILAQNSDHRWMLAGFFSRPMLEAGHDGIWYWQTARKYSQQNMSWNSWLYYRTAAYLLDPVNFLSSPNLQKLQQEQDRVPHDTLPGAQPLMLSSHGAFFQVTGVDMTAALGALDLDVNYTPNEAQVAQLHDPTAARSQVIQIMQSLLILHPELAQAFHGIWVHADQGNAAIYSLELPMDQIAAATQPAPPNAISK